jgi:hypothetical protein
MNRWWPAYMLGYSRALNVEESPIGGIVTQRQCDYERMSVAHFQDVPRSQPHLLVSIHQSTPSILPQ